MRVFKSDFNLRSEQLNELYNYVTQDGKRTLNFSAFEEFINQLDVTRKPSGDQLLCNELVLRPNQHQLILENFEKLMILKDLASFKDLIVSQIENYNNNLFDWTDDLISDLFQLICKSSLEIETVKQLLLQAIRVEEEALENDGRRRTTSSVSLNTQFNRIKLVMKSRLDTFVKNFEKYKNRMENEESEKLFVELIKFGEHCNSCIDDFSDINQQYNSYMNILNGNIEELHLLIEKNKLKEVDILNENSKLKLQYGMLNRNNRNRVV